MSILGTRVLRTEDPGFLTRGAVYTEDVQDDRLTGDLQSPPPAGEARGTLLEEYAARNGIVLSDSFAYADSLSDLPMLELVGTLKRSQPWHGRSDSDPSGLAGRSMSASASS